MQTKLMLIEIKVQIFFFLRYRLPFFISNCFVISMQFIHLKKKAHILFMMSKNDGAIRVREMNHNNVMMKNVYILHCLTDCSFILRQPLFLALF